MKCKISFLIDKFKRATTLQNWVEEQKVIARNSAYQNRPVIYKREIEEEIKRLNSIVNLWKIFKKLRKKSLTYDATIEVDGKGYISLVATFPITQGEFDAAWENKRKWNAENKGYEMCCRIDEQIYNVSHTRIEKELSGLILNAHNSYSGTNLVRQCDIIDCVK